MATTLILDSQSATVKMMLILEVQVKPKLGHPLPRGLSVHPSLTPPDKCVRFHQSPCMLLVILRQDIGGPQGEQFLPCGQKLHNSRNSIKAGWWRRLGPAQIRDKRPHIPNSQSQGDLPDYTCTERFLGSQKRRGCHLIVSGVNYEDTICVSDSFHLA